MTQIYMMVTLCIKEERGVGFVTFKDYVNISYSASIPEVIKFISNDNPNWERACYEFPQMKQVTQAEVKIS